MSELTDASELARFIQASGGRQPDGTLGGRGSPPGPHYGGCGRGAALWGVSGGSAGASPSRKLTK
jgi:hypothetical protein